MDWGGGKSLFSLNGDTLEPEMLGGGSSDHMGQQR